jgi:hypothetical protein
MFPSTFSISEKPISTYSDDFVSIPVNYVDTEGEVIFFNESIEPVLDMSEVGYFASISTQIESDGNIDFYLNFDLHILY